MQRTLGLVTLWAVSLFALGCSSVQFPAPVGEPVEIDEAKQLQGVWAMGEQAVYIRHLENHKLRIALVDWDKDANDYKLKTFTVFATKAGDERYLNIQSADAPKDSPSFGVLRLSRFGDETLVVHGVKVSTWQAAVEQGQLAGEVDKQEHSVTVHLSATKSQIDDFLAPDRAAEQFDLDHPIVLRKLAKP